MADDKKKNFRLSLEERHNDPRRVWSWRFKLDDERQQQARKKLEQWELQYFDQTGEEVSLSEIITDIVLDLEYGRPSPRMDEKRISNMILQRLQTLETLVQDIAEREPVVMQGAVENYKTKGGEIEDDFISNMLDDFDNTGGR